MGNGESGRGKLGKRGACLFTYLPKLGRSKRQEADVRGGGFWLEDERRRKIPLPCIIYASAADPRAECRMACFGCKKSQGMGQVLASDAHISQLSVFFPLF